MPDDLKVLLESSVKEFSRNLVARIRRDDETIAKQAKTLGFEPIAWSAEVRGKFRAVAREVWKVYAARSEMAKKVNDSQVTFLKKAGLLD